MQTFIVSDFDLKKSKLRLDSFLSEQLKESKNQIQNLIKTGQVCLNNTPCVKNGALLKSGDCISLCPSHNRPQIQNLDSENREPNDTKDTLESQLEGDPRFEIAILHQDEDLLIINKPPHLIIHEAPSVKEPTLTHWLQLHAHTLHTLSGEERHGIIHRLDKQTSGALAIAKSSLAYTQLSAQLKSRQMGRYYLAIIDTPLKEHLQIHCYMGRSPNNRLKMSKIHIKGEHIPKGVRDSKSSFVKLATSDNGGCELIAIKLHTGRTHQIRVHLESIQRHILGDSLYGYKAGASSYRYEQRILLHAYLLYLTHPRSGENLIFKAPILTDMLEFLQSHFTKDLPDDCSDIMELLQEDRLIRAFERFS